MSKRPNKEKSLLPNFVTYEMQQKFKKELKKNYNEQSWM